MLGNVARQTGDTHLACHVIEDTAVELHTRRLARNLDRHIDLDHLVHLNADEIRVNQVPLDGVDLVFLDHHVAPGVLLRQAELENRVDAGFGVDDLENHLRVHDHRDRIALRPVDDRRDQSLVTQPAGGILSQALPALHIDDDFLHATFPCARGPACAGPRGSKTGPSGEPGEPAAFAPGLARRTASSPTNSCESS